jgi:hypothetical protein
MKMVEVTGSEVAASHKGTFNIDVAYRQDGWVYAPADGFISAVDMNLYVPGVSSNIVYFETDGPVITPTFTDIVTMRMAHGNDADLKALGVARGKHYKQGERIYKQGVKGTTSAHVHLATGRGKFKSPGTIKIGTGSAPSILTTGGRTHTFDTFYLRKGTPVYKWNNGWIQDTYVWKVEPTITPATMADVKNLVIKTKSTLIKVRAYPTTATGSVQLATLPLNAIIPVLAKSTNIMNGYTWLKVNIAGVIGYSAYMPTIMTLVDTTPVVIPPVVVPPVVVDPTVELKKELAVALANSAAKDVTIAEDAKVTASLKAEVAAFKIVAKPLYEKA